LLNVRNTKSGKDRLVPVISVVRQLLESLPKSSGHVFPSPHTRGRPVDVKASFSAARAAAKISEFRFHDLRHTAASRMAGAGADAFTPAAIFGWSDIRMSLSYTHAMDDAERRAVENLAGKQRPREKSVTKEKRQTVGSAVNS
jgi:integrase